MRKFLLLVCTLTCLFSIHPKIYAQVFISGTIYDSSKLYGVSDVIVRSSAGNSVTSDSVGGYKILVNETDSLSFFYNNKPTQKFPVKKIENYTAFDISLQVRLTSKYKPLKEIVIFSKTFAEKTAENRQTYSKVFGYKKPGLVSSSNPNSPPGLDIGELIRVFQFRRNKQLKAFRNRLLAEEEEKYIDYRFNSKLLKRITHLEGDSLILYQNIYRPGYNDLLKSDDLALYSYILKTAEKFRRKEL